MYLSHISTPAPTFMDMLLFGSGYYIEVDGVRQYVPVHAVEAVPSLRALVAEAFDRRNN